MRLLARSLSSVAGLDKAVAPFLAPAIVARRHQSSQPAAAREAEGERPSGSSPRAHGSPSPPPFGRWVDAFARTVRDASSDGAAELPPAVRAELLRIHPRCPDALRELLDGSRPSSSAKAIDDDALAAYISAQVKGRAGRLRLHYRNAAPPALDALAALAHICATQSANRSLDVITHEVTRWIRERRELADSSSSASRPTLASYAPVSAILRSRLQLGNSSAISAALFDFTARRTEAVQSAVAQRRLTTTYIMAARLDELEPLWERATSSTSSQPLSNSLLAALIQRFGDLSDEDKGLELAERALEGALQVWSTETARIANGKHKGPSRRPHPPVAPLRALIELRLTLLERSLTADASPRRAAENMPPGGTTAPGAGQIHFRTSRPGRRQRQEAHDSLRIQLGRIRDDTDLLARLEAEAVADLRGDPSAASARIASIRSRSLAHVAVLGLRVFSLARREDLMLVEAERLSSIEATPAIMPKLNEAMRIVTAHVERSDRALEAPSLLVWAARTLDMAHGRSLFLSQGAGGTDDARRAPVQLTSAIKHALRASLDRSDEAVGILMDLARRTSSAMSVPHLFDNKATVDGAFRWAMRMRRKGDGSKAEEISTEEADRETLHRLETLLAVLVASKPKPRVRAWVDETLEAMAVSLENRARWEKELRRGAAGVEMAAAAKAESVADLGEPRAPSAADVAGPDDRLAATAVGEEVEEELETPRECEIQPLTVPTRSASSDDVCSSSTYLPRFDSGWSLRTSGSEIWDPPYPTAQRQTASSSQRCREERSMSVRLD